MTESQHSREALRLVGMAHHFTYGDGADSAAGLALATEAQVYATLALASATSAAAAPRTVYRASHGSIVMGLYTTPQAARDHCEASVRQEVGQTGSLGWVPDDSAEASPGELAIFGPGSDEDGPEVIFTGYVVIPLTVATAYAPDAE